MSQATAPVIEIVVSPKGEVTVRTRGFNGGKCRDASRFLEQALGTRAAEQLTPEFYLKASVSESARLQN